MRIMVAGHFNLNNGDRAVLESTIQHIIDNFEAPEIVVSAVKPRQLKDHRFTTVAWPIKQIKGSGVLTRAFLRRGRRIPRILLSSDYLRELAQVDLVLVSGGHHLTDLLGLNSLYNLLASFVIPIQAGKKVVLLPQSIGPFQNCATEKDLKAVSDVLERADKVYIRDRSSAECVSQISPRCDYKFVPDMVYGLSIENRAHSSRSVGIALYCSYATEPGKLRMSKVHSAIKSVCLKLNQHGYAITIVPMESRDYSGDDRPAAKAIIDDVRAAPNWDDSFPICVQEPNDPSDIRTTVELFSGKQLVIGCKTHSVVFCATVGTPVIAVAYHKKSIDFMNSMGLGNYSIMDYDVNEDRLWGLVSSALEEGNAIKEAQNRFVARSRSEIDTLFKELSKDAG